MNHLLTFCMVLAFVGTCAAQSSASQTSPPCNGAPLESLDTAMLEFYCQYSEFTDPGEYIFMYANLPDSLPLLCRLVKSQFLHPYAELPRYRDQVPEERWNEMGRYSTVRSILEGLYSLDSSGLVANREPSKRLILGCRDYSILLASILKSRGIPARVRCGHASYLIPDFHASHTLCEVWNKQEKRWMLVDPSTEMVDFSKEKFDYSHELWKQFQNGEIDPDRYGFPGRYTGLVSIAGKICSDLSFVLGMEHTVFQYAPVLEYVFQGKELPAETLELLNQVSRLMHSLNRENIALLEDVYHKNPVIQLTESFGKKTVSPVVSEK